MPQYVALESIQHNGVYAYHAGDDVPADNVARHGYEVGRQVAVAGSEDAQRLWARLGGTTVEFDPLRHGVDEVNAHLAGADEQERARVLEAERATQHRRGILEGPHAGAPEEEFGDPGGHTVEEVNDHLDRHPEREPAMLVAERGGQARKGILEGRHAHAMPAPDVAEL